MLCTWQEASTALALSARQANARLGESMEWTKRSLRCQSATKVVFTDQVLIIISAQGGPKYR